MVEQEIEQKTYTFNPREHLMDIKNKAGASEYLPVQWRLVWVNEHCPELKITIVEKVIDPDRVIEKEVYQWNNTTRRSEKVLKRASGWAYFHVRVEDGKGKVGEAVKAESAVDFDDYIEKADTGATGRALAKIGWGTQFVGTEFDELPNRIVDAPVDRSQSSTGSQNTSKSSASSKPSSQSTATTDDNKATDQQLASIRKLLQHLGKPEPEDEEKMTYLDAKTTIIALSAEYKEKQNSKPTSEPLPSKKDLFESGKSKNMWNRPEEFYAACSVVLESSVNAANWDSLKREQVAQLVQHIEEAEPLSLSA